MEGSSDTILNCTEMSRSRTFTTLMLSVHLKFEGSASLPDMPRVAMRMVVSIVVGGRPIPFSSKSHSPSVVDENINLHIWVLTSEGQYEISSKIKATIASINCQHYRISTSTLDVAGRVSCCGICAFTLSLLLLDIR